MPDSPSGADGRIDPQPQARSRPSEILIVGCCYYLSPAVFLGRLSRYAASAGCVLRGVVVDNRARPGPSEAHGVSIVAGSNASLDFSGYFEGLEYLEKKFGGDRLTGVVFVNDSLITKHHGELVFRMTAALCRLAQDLRCAAIVGFSARYSSICVANPWSGLDTYVSSFCFFLNSSGLEMFRQLPQLALSDGVEGSAALDEADWGSGLSQSFREMIRGHLLYEHSPYRWQGLRSGDATGDVVVKKARCAYFEHRLSGSIGRAGAIVPINAGGRAATKLFIGERWMALLRPALRLLSGRRA